MNIDLPIKVEVKGKATVRYDLPAIERRLAVIVGRTDQTAKEEIALLEKVKTELRTK